jgi:hypothetical protein
MNEEASSSMEPSSRAADASDDATMTSAPLNSGSGISGTVAEQDDPKSGMGSNWNNPSSSSTTEEDEKGTFSQMMESAKEKMSNLFTSSGGGAPTQEEQEATVDKGSNMGGVA